MEASLLARGKKDTKPLFLKLGLALALSLASYFASRLWLKPRIQHPPSGDDAEEVTVKKSTIAGSSGLRDELVILKNEEALAKIINGTAITTTSVSCGDEKGFLLPEFDQFVLREFQISPKNLEAREVEMEEEIAYLKNLIEELKVRERSLEARLLEYQGLKDQEVTLRELENRLKVSAMETKFLSLKIESLQDENKRLHEQVLDYSRITTELESSREIIKLLKRKLELEGEELKKEIACLLKRLSELQERKHKEAEDGVEVIKKLERFKELENEVVDLRNINMELAEENSKLIQQLQSAKMTSSDHANAEVESLNQAAHLREENENLKKEIEQLQTDRCADVEEMVYLRWLNACLRYELRNYQPPPGKTVAKDLSKSLSHKSEEKAKELILEYSDSVSMAKARFMDFDSESCSSSLTSNEDCSDTSMDISTSTKNHSSSKLKVFSKLKKLVLRKDAERSKVSSVCRTPMSCADPLRRASMSPYSFEGTVGRRNSCDSISSCISTENTSTNKSVRMDRHLNEQWQNKVQAQNCSKPSLDIQRPTDLNLECSREDIGERCKSDIGASYGYRRVIDDDSPRGLSHNISLNHDYSDVPEKDKLKKFAEVLKSSRGSLKMKKRLNSFSSR